jgi:hypothetical protein
MGYSSTGVRSYNTRIQEVSVGLMLGARHNGGKCGCVAAARTRICTSPAELLPLEIEFKTKPVPENEIRMFPDEIEAIRIGFERLFPAATEIPAMQS